MWQHSAILFKSSMRQWIRRPEVHDLVKKQLVPDTEQAGKKRVLLWAGRKTCDHEDKVRMVGKR